MAQVSLSVIYLDRPRESNESHRSVASRQTGLQPCAFDRETDANIGKGTGTSASDSEQDTGLGSGRNHQWKITAALCWSWLASLTWLRRAPEHSRQRDR